jgi:plasmid stability protein
MAALTIPDLPDQTRAWLSARAERAGRTPEAEALAILVSTGAQESPETGAERLQDFVDDLYGRARPEGVVDALILERRREASGE